MTLHCPATLLIARHGDAAYAHAHVLSDDGGWLTPKGKDQVQTLAQALMDRRIAAVYTSTMERAVESGQIAAADLGVATRQVDGLEEFHVGDFAGVPYSDPRPQAIFDEWLAGRLDVAVPGGESGAQIVERYRTALEEIADQHRGETVLVFTHGGVMSLVLPRISGNVRDDLAKAQFLPNAEPATVESGDDGWRVIFWPGTADRHSV